MAGRSKKKRGGYCGRQPACIPCEVSQRIVSQSQWAVGIGISTCHLSRAREDKKREAYTHALASASLQYSYPVPGTVCDWLLMAGRDPAARHGTAGASGNLPDLACSSSELLIKRQAGWDCKRNKSRRRSDEPICRRPPPLSTRLGLLLALHTIDRARRRTWGGACYL